MSTKKPSHAGTARATGWPPAHATAPTVRSVEPSSISHVNVAAWRRTIAALRTTSASVDATARLAAHGAPASMAIAPAAPSAGAASAQAWPSATARSSAITVPKAPSTSSGPWSRA
ncbi:MAG: hypothetical protein HS111_12185 [Kofleriaceae bacterium]|nr:hypothetical protein [Kofleriaceae bacterium]